METRDQILGYRNKRGEQIIMCKYCNKKATMSNMLAHLKTKTHKLTV